MQRRVRRRFRAWVATYAVAVQPRQRRSLTPLPDVWQRFVGPIVMTVGASVALVGTFFGWVRSGTVTRSSYEMLGLIERLGFAPDGLAELVIRAWPIVPLLLTSAVVAVWWGRRIVAAVLGFVGGLYAGALGAVVTSAVPDSRQVGVSAAPLVTALGAGVLVLGSVLALTVRVPSADAR